MSAFFSSGVEAFWPHFWLLGGALLGGILVGVGIVLETPENPSRKQCVAVLLVIIGIIVEPICTLGLFAFDEGISDAQKSKIASLICKNTALENILAPRILAPSRLMSRGPIYGVEMDFERPLNQYSGTSVKIQSAEDADAESLADDIKFLLDKVHWKPERTTESESHFAPTEIRPGISVYTDHWHPSDAIDASAKALLLALGGLANPVLRGMPPQRGVTGPNFDDNSGFIYVAVGSKPIGEQLQELKLHPPTSCGSTPP